MRIWCWLFILILHIIHSNQSRTLCRKELKLKNCILLPRDDRCGPLKKSPKIVGGRDAVLGEFPWIALLHSEGINASNYIKMSEICGGAIINEKYIVSAAHCFYDGHSLNTARVGEYNVHLEFDCTANGKCAPAPQDIEIETYTKHNYNENTRQNDIAIVRLKNKMKFNSYVIPICLPTGSTFLKENVLFNGSLEVAGWGINNQEVSNPTQPNVLQALAVPYVSRQDCAKVWENVAFPKPISKSNLCAGGVKDQDSCPGDSGGPLSGEFSLGSLKLYRSTRSFLIGVVSFGYNLRCGSSGWPGVYVNVPYYVRWIVENMRR